MKLQRLLSTLVLLWFLCAGACGAAEPRTALVIGNGTYGQGALPNAINDASDVADVLRRAGFDMLVKVDADQRNMVDVIQGFGRKLKANGGIGLFYFAGHGVQVDGANYIVPVGSGINSERDLRARAVYVGEVLDAMAAAKNGLNIVILDACRNNPFPAKTRSMEGGLARLDSNAGTFISFSTSPGAVALDGDGRNSPYTKHLVAAIDAPDLTIEETFKRTLKGVYQETGGQQTPWISSSFFGDFIFHPTRTTAPTFVPPSALTTPREPPRTAAPQLTTGTVPALAGVYRADGTNPDGSRYRGMVALTPSGKDYTFKWWISRHVFSGTGRFAGRMLVVEWGQKSPVLYTLSAGKRLDGEWADGTASERLELFAGAAQSAISAPSGRYRVTGRNPNGAIYSGAARITSDGRSQYRMDWTVGPTKYAGTGTLEGNLLTVDWGSTTPVVYAIAADGKLNGLWAGGSGEETLIPDR
jgi:hypothetical protein